MIYLELFWSFFQVGLFSIGGGYAAMPLIQTQVVDQHGWLSLSEFIDVITISQMTPGPIGINSATFVGIKIAGIGGALIATLGCVLPSCIIVLTLAHFYFKYQNLTAVRGVLNGLRPAVVAMIASAGLSILLNASFAGGALSSSLADVSWIGICLFLAAFIVLRKWKPNPIWVMLGCGVLGMFLFRFFGIPGQ